MEATGRRAPESRITWPRTRGLRCRVYTVHPDGSTTPEPIRDPSATPALPLARPFEDCRCPRCRPDLHEHAETGA